MKMIKNNYKLILYNLMAIILTGLVGIKIINNTNHTSKLNITTKEKHINDRQNNYEISDESNIINKLIYISHYLKLIVRKQYSLLYQINHSAFHTIQKNAFIKHRYVADANKSIKHSNISLKSERLLINKIIPIIQNHLYTYEYFLEIKKYIIPNYDFFIKKHTYNNQSNSNIKINIYNINNSNSLNDISLASEETTFSTKAISKTGFAIISATFRDYKFNANIISFNSKKNSFEFKKLDEDDSVKNDKTNKYLKINNSTKTFNNVINSVNNSNASVLTNTISGYIYPMYFRLYNDICFKTHLDFGHAKSIKPSKNYFTYILLPVLIVLLISIRPMEVAITASLLHYNRIIKTKKQIQFKNYEKNEDSSKDYLSKIGNNVDSDESLSSIEIPAHTYVDIYDSTSRKLIDRTRSSQSPVNLSVDDAQDLTKQEYLEGINNELDGLTAWSSEPFLAVGLKKSPKRTTAENHETISSDDESDDDLMHGVKNVDDFIFRNIINQRDGKISKKRKILSNNICKTRIEVKNYTKNGRKKSRKNILLEITYDEKSQESYFVINENIEKGFTYDEYRTELCLMINGDYVLIFRKISQKDHNIPRTVGYKSDRIRTMFLKKENKITRKNKIRCIQLDPKEDSKLDNTMYANITNLSFSTTDGLNFVHIPMIDETQTLKFDIIKYADTIG